MRGCEGGFRSIFLQEQTTPAIPRLYPPFARSLLHAFSLMYSQIFVSNATLSFSQQPRPPSQARTGVPFAYTCSIAREYANSRDGRSPFSSTLCRRGGIHFAAQRPRLPRTAPPFDCFDYPYLIPRSSSLQPFSNHFGVGKVFSFFFDLDSPFSFRDIGKRPYTSRRCGSCRGDPSPQVYPEIPNGFHLHQKGDS